MYKITHFDKKLCHLMRHHLDLVDENNCDIYSIWHFCPRTRGWMFKNFFTSKALCQPGYFPLIYWLVLIISIMGCIHSFNEFTSLFWGDRKRVTMWRQRKFYILPSTVLRKCRLVGALIMIFVWLLLCYAVLNVSPALMTPWLSINIFVLGFELITWIIEAFMGIFKLELHTLLSFGLTMTNYLFVTCVQSAFQKAIEINDEENLRLWKNVKNIIF